MPIGWLAILKNVPWTEVIRNAPAVADGAKKLWKTVGKKSSSAEVLEANEQVSVSPEAQNIAALEVRTRVLEAEVTDLHEQMLAASELIKTLADQNTQLIQRIEVNRKRVLWLSAVTIVIAIVVLLGVFFIVVPPAT